MLAIRYDKETGAVSAWTEIRFEMLDRGRDNEAVAELDIERPAGRPTNYQYNGGELVLAKPIEEPEEPRDLLVEIDELRAKVEKKKK